MLLLIETITDVILLLTGLKASHLGKSLQEMLPTLEKLVCCQCVANLMNWHGSSYTHRMVPMGSVCVEKEANMSLLLLIVLFLRRR